MTDATLYSIDPGIPECAAAFWRNRRLTWAGKLRQDCTTNGDTCAAVVELPQVDGRGVPAAGLIKLAAAGAITAGRLCRGPVSFVTPSEWKGSTKKPIHHGRMWDALSTAEWRLLGYHATLDAITAAKDRGAKHGWRKKSSADYYRKRELQTVDGVLIDHNILDAVALGLWHLGRIDQNGYPT